ncbi:MAG: hypothetical protein IPK80_02855 [Nannocystis sp.]|nr:hypothetical protein [Nannocystis sp.]
MTALDDVIVEMVRARPMRVSEIASAAKLAALRLVDSGALVVGDDYVVHAAGDVNMRGWRTIAIVGPSTIGWSFPTREEILAAHEEGRRIRAHYAREIAAMRDVDRREVVR